MPGLHFPSECHTAADYERQAPVMHELKCPECGYMNPDIRELGYRLPWTCGKCPHIWRLQDLMSEQKPMPADMAKALADNLRDLCVQGDEVDVPEKLCEQIFKL